MRFARSSTRAAPAILLVVGVLGGCAQKHVPPLRPPRPPHTRVRPPPAAPRRVESTPSGPSVAPASVPVSASRALPKIQASTGNRPPHAPAAPPAVARLAPASRSSAPLSPPPVTAAPLAHAGTLDLKSLEQRLRNTHAIGLFTKLSLKNQVDDLLAQFRALYNGQSHASMADLHQRYDLLLMKVLSLLQGSDPPLAADIAASRGAIWGILSDPKKFAKMQL